MIINLADALDRRTPTPVLESVVPEIGADVRGVRNRLALDVDKAVLWTAITRDLPESVERLLAEGVLTPERFLG